jgi:hypothetical protein
MDMKKKAQDIYTSLDTKELKIQQLNTLLEDCLMEMDAENQNMNPEVDHNLSEGYQAAKMYLETLKNYK